nr:OB-fold nucleic acid binding domain-containing protein [Bacteriovoracaceae bacterium]
MQKNKERLYGSEFLLKTHHCGKINRSHQSKNVSVCGWVNKTRDLGGITFCDLRDKYGILQLNFTNFKGDLNLLKLLSLETVIQCQGVVELRPENSINPQMSTGEVELMVTQLKILSQAETLPFLPQSHTEATEDLRLRYR